MGFVIANNVDGTMQVKLDKTPSAAKDAGFRTAVGSTEILCIPEHCKYMRIHSALAVNIQISHANIHFAIIGVNL
jgi:hypothetical protein